MNREQRNYAIAKAAYLAADQRRDEVEQVIIIREGIRNADGSIPTLVYTMTEYSGDEFDRVCNIVCNDSEFKAANEWKNLCRDFLTEAEDALIDFGLSIVPASVRITLNRHRNDYDTRKKLIDAAFRLDANTIQKGV